MKIFVVGPERMDTFIHNVAHTFKKMGHDVQSDSEFRSKAMRSRYQTAAVEILSRTSKKFRMRDDRRAIQIANYFKPDLVFVGTRTLEPETVHAIRKKHGCPAVCWYGDTPGNLKRNHITSGEYDAVFVKDKRFSDDLRNVLGLNAFHLHEACNPDWHRPIEVSVSGHLLVAGTLYGYRSAIIEKLLNLNRRVKVFGPLPSPWISKVVKEAHTGIFLDHTNKAFEFSKAIACLNTFAPAERDTLNCRIFESCGSGGLLISEHKNSLDECFDPYEEYLPVSSVDQLLEQIDRVQCSPEYANKIRQNAVNRAHSKHSYLNRLQTILDSVS